MVEKIFLRNEEESRNRRIAATNNDIPIPAFPDDLLGWIELRSNDTSTQAIGYSWGECEIMKTIADYILLKYGEDSHNNLTEQTNIQTGHTNLSDELEKVAIAWVNRPHIPRKPMKEFLEDIQINGGPYITTDQLKKAIPILYNQGKIDRLKSRYHPKLEFKN